MRPLFSIAIFILLLLALCFTGCKKEGRGGSSRIDGMAYVKDSTGQLMDADGVLIKYGTKEFPGYDITLYDDDALVVSGYTFIGLKRGDYYLLAYSYALTPQTTQGKGVTLKWKEKKRENLLIEL